MSCEFKLNISQICQEHGISRQGYYKWRQSKSNRFLQEEIVLQYVYDIRRRLPKLGGRKLHYLLKKKFEEVGFSIGRDRLFDLLRQHGLLIERHKKYISTTNSKHRFYIYDNLIKGLEITRKNEVIVTDITYIELEIGFCYLALITDVYSRKIVGYDLSESLSIEGSIRALKTALKKVKNKHKMIHHSDRGIQYCSKKYIQLLQEGGAKISMSEKGNPYENAIAERVNGILKIEFLLDQAFKSFKHAQKATIEAIKLYNEERPHMSIGLLTPNQKYAACI